MSCIGGSNLSRSIWDIIAYNIAISYLEDIGDLGEKGCSVKMKHCNRKRNGNITLRVKKRM